MAKLRIIMIWVRWRISKQNHRVKQVSYFLF